MFFDAHGDILTDVAIELNQNRDVWELYHKDKYERAGVNSGIFVNFTMPSYETQSTDFQKISELALPYFKNREDFNIITKANSFVDDKFNLIFGIEGANCLELSDLEDLYKQGYRHIGLTWNEKNKFATGCAETGGLTNLGIELVKKAEELGMIVDYAHLNRESFDQVSEIATKPILFSHGNVDALCPHARNLTDEQLLKIKATNGVIGLAAMNFFLNKDKTVATIDDLIAHVAYLVDLIGIDHIGFGFDFCYYLNTRNSYNDVEGLRHIDDIHVLPEKLKAIGLSDEDIAKISYKNMHRLVNESLS